MYAFKFLCRTNRLILNNCKKSTSHLINHERAVARKNFCSRFDIRRETENDVLLFEYDRTYQFLGLNVLAISQFIFWSYLGRFLYRDVKNTEIDMKSKFWNWLYSKERKYSTGLSIAVVVCGFAVLITVYFYTARSVKSLILHKGGKNLTIVTHKFPGFKSSIKVPLSEVSSSFSRKKAKNYIPLKVKNTYFYYLIDTQGEFKNPLLFDYTAGVERNF